MNVVICAYARILFSSIAFPPGKGVCRFSHWLENYIISGIEVEIDNSTNDLHIVCKVGEREVNQENFNIKREFGFVYDILVFKRTKSWSNSCCRIL